MTLEALWVNFSAQKKAATLGPALRALQGMQGGEDDSQEVVNVLVKSGQFIDCERSDATVRSRTGKHIHRPRTSVEELM
eukprot:13486225-Alexandrium_andersonii.AAC.1